MTEHEENLHQYIEQMADLQRSLSTNSWIYHGVEDIVSKIGKFDIVGALPHDVKRGKMGMCFMNAFRLMGRGYTYVEGIAIPLSISFPVHHAWCVDSFGNVLDPTWADGAAYVGIHLCESFVYQRALRRKKYGIFGDTDSFDLYENGLPQNAIQL